MGLAAVAALVFTVGAGAFEKVPEAARSALKGVRGKNVSTGFVFADGHYLKPPYKVARYGTAIFVNDVQITDQIVSWRSFLATQDGSAPAAPTAAPAKKAPAAATDDDLFDDAPPPKSAAEVAQEQARQDAAVAAGFTPNAKSARLLKRIDEQRIEVRRKLRAGNVCFFGSRYARIVVEPRLAKQLLAFLPEALRDASDAGALAAACRAQGFPFLTRPVCEDLLANRADYLPLIERRRRLEEDEALQRMFENAQEARR